jgi:5-methylcytosine-specific restriction endonuclease McrA
METLKSKIIALRAEGKTYAVIAETLGCAKDTVHYHVNPEYHKKKRDNRTKNRRLTKQKLVTMTGGKCQVCGYERCIDALQFHHLNPAEKSFSIGESRYNFFDKLVEEVKKCVLLCANCHAEVEAEITQVPNAVTPLSEKS